MASKKVAQEDVEGHIESFIIAMAVLDDDELDMACRELTVGERDRLLDALGRVDAD